jgi:hypothetical protein
MWMHTGPTEVMKWETKFSFISGLIRVVGSQFTFFYYPISCLHLCLANIKFFVAFFKSTTLSFLATFAHLSSLSFHDCKRENFSFRGRISITICTVMIFLSICLLHLPFVYRYVAERTFKLCSLDIFILIA